MSSRRFLGVLNSEPYRGQAAELVVGIDVGLTFSGVCYAFLLPGEIPEVQSVTRFTDQLSGDSKIASALYYDKNSTLIAAGASASLRTIVEEAQYEDWDKAQCFKILMGPPDPEIETDDLRQLGDLAMKKNVVEITADFLRYLYSETLKYIDNHHVDGDELLEKVAGQTKFVLSLPNGWAGLPQQRMREAAILGGLVKDSEDGRRRISFVSEGEASALSCLAGSLCPHNLERGYRFMIADLGGGTIDVTTYEVTQRSPVRLRELTSSGCRFAGSTFVNIKAREILRAKLRGTQYDNPVILDEIIDEEFEHTTKREFGDAKKISWLRVGDRAENDPKLGIRRGFLRLDGAEVASCFEYSISEIRKSIKTQMSACGGNPMQVWLVGGFASSPWLSRRLRADLWRDGVVVKCPDMNLSKAVAHGNVLHYLEQPVLDRVTRSTYGIVCDTHYQNTDPDHRRRRKFIVINLSGDRRLPGKFDVLVSKNTVVRERQVFSRHYHRHIQDPKDRVYRFTLLKTDEDVHPVWYDEARDKFQRVCRIETDLSELCRPSTLGKHNGVIFWILHFDVEIMFGLPELQARIRWIENGQTRYFPSTIMYE